MLLRLLFPYFMSTVLLEIFWKLTQLVQCGMDAIGIRFYFGHDYWNKAKGKKREEKDTGGSHRLCRCSNFPHPTLLLRYCQLLILPENFWERSRRGKRRKPGEGEFKHGIVKQVHQPLNNIKGMEKNVRRWKRMNKRGKTAVMLCMSQVVKRRLCIMNQRSRTRSNRVVRVIPR